MIHSSDNLITLEISIPNSKDAAFPMSEYGIHRLTRVSPFGNGKLHTSHVKVVVKEKTNFVIEPLQECDVVYEAFKSTGPGGQHKNKTLSSIRATHRPSGLIAIAQRGRSQHDNKVEALQNLQFKWQQIQTQKHFGEKEVAWRENQQLAIVRHYLENHNQVVQNHITKRLQDWWRGNLPIPLKD